MKKTLLFGVMAAVVMVWGCKKTATNNLATNQVTSVNQIKVPDGFLWESSHNVAFNVQITDTRFGTTKHKISIYDGDPYNGGNLIAEGSAATDNAYVNTVYLSKQLTQVYVVKTSPDNSKIINTVNVSGPSASIVFGATDPSVAHRGSRMEGSRTTSDCSSGCTTTITTSTSNVNVNTGNVICITGSNITVSFSSVNGGMVRVCGTNVTLQNFNLSGTTTLLVTTAGSASVSGLNFNSTTATIQNDGTLTGSFAVSGIFINNGTYTSTSDLNINSGGTFTNNGTLTVNGNFNNSATSASSTNNASMTVTGTFQQNGGCTAFVNNCSLAVNGNYNQSAPVKNYNLIKVLGTTTLNSSAQLSLYNTAMLKANNVILNSPIVGSGSTSMVKITGYTTVNSGGSFSGALQINSTNTISSSYLASGAAFGNSLYIPVTSCNGEGNGTAVVADADGDGVPDSLDAYPNDATKAYNSYYPSNNGGATVAFEDQWPSKGDYDLNDVVMGYKYQVVTSAANNVVQVIGNYTLCATGGSRNSGFAVQFPVSSANVNGVTGGTLQSGQTNATVTLFTNTRNEMAQWNTVPGVTQSPVKTYTVSFNVSSGPAIGTFGLSSYNPFTWNITGYEIHLPGHLPTNLADQSVFGSQDDNTNVAAGRYYVTKTGLPYAIDVPVNPYSYPVEDTDITRAYLHFSDWATSGATSFLDWYSNTASGYRITNNIYTH